ADGEPMGGPQQQGHDRAAPAAAQQAEGPGSLRGDQADGQVSPAGGEARPGAARLAGQGVEAALREAPLPAGDGPGGAVEDGGDGGPGVAIGQQQQDVGPEAEFGVGEGGAVVVDGGGAFGRGP